MRRLSRIVLAVLAAAVLGAIVNAIVRDEAGAQGKTWTAGTVSYTGTLTDALPASWQVSGYDLAQRGAMANETHTNLIFCPDGDCRPLPHSALDPQLHDFTLVETAQGATSTPVDITASINDAYQLTTLSETRPANDFSVQFQSPTSSYFRIIRLDIASTEHPAGNSYGTWVWEYQNPSNTWVSLQNVVDGSEGFTKVGKSTVTFDLPRKFSNENSIRARLTSAATTTTHLQSTQIRQAQWEKGYGSIWHDDDDDDIDIIAGGSLRPRSDAHIEANVSLTLPSLVRTDTYHASTTSSTLNSWSFSRWMVRPPQGLGSFIFSARGNRSEISVERPSFTGSNGKLDIVCKRRQDGLWESTSLQLPSSSPFMGYNSHYRLVVTAAQGQDDNISFLLQRGPSNVGMGTVKCTLPIDEAIAFTLRPEVSTSGSLNSSTLQVNDGAATTTQSWTTTRTASNIPGGWTLTTDAGSGHAELTTRALTFDPPTAASEDAAVRNPKDYSDLPDFSSTGPASDLPGSSLVNVLANQARIPAQALWIVFGFGLAIAALVFTQRFLDNIAISSIVGGIVLMAVASPTVGIASIWALLVYSLMSGVVVVIGKRISI